MFSSSSLSKTIVLHLGHLVHRPSGISRFFDFEEASFGFLTKVVLVLAGGGVTAGSAVSRPSVFFVNKVVAISARSLSFFTSSHKSLDRQRSGVLLNPAIQDLANTPVAASYRPRA